MRIAIPQWQDRISPVFDVAANLLLVDIDKGRESRREERRLSGTDASARIAEFLGFGVEVLICGAISTPVEARLRAAGVLVIGFTCGPVDAVLAAYLKGEVANRVFLMPGCHARCRQEGGNTMPRNMEMGDGRGGGIGGGGRGKGRGMGCMRGPLGAAPGSTCVCPNCGEKAPHTPG